MSRVTVTFPSRWGLASKTGLTSDNADQVTGWQQRHITFPPLHFILYSFQIQLVLFVRESTEMQHSGEQREQTPCHSTPRSFCSPIGRLPLLWAKVSLENPRGAVSQINVSKLSLNDVKSSEQLNRTIEFLRWDSEKHVFKILIKFFLPERQAEMSVKQACIQVHKLHMSALLTGISPPRWGPDPSSGLILMVPPPLHSLCLKHTQHYRNKTTAILHCPKEQ